MILYRFSSPLFRFLHSTNKPFIYYRCASTDRPETISSALKRFYMKVHPDLFSQYPTEKDVNEKSLQLVSAYLSSLQRKEFAASITVTFYTKASTTQPTSAPTLLTPRRIHLNSKDLLTSVNTILTGLDIPMIQVPTPEKQPTRLGLQFKVVEIEKNFDFTKIPKISIETWLISNTELARSKAKQYKQSLNNISEKIEEFKTRFRLRSIEYNDDWSVSQFYACLTTLSTYVDKWHERLQALQGKRLIFGNTTCLLQDGSLQLGANDPPVYWDHVICMELLEIDVYMEKIASYEERLCKYFRGIQIRRDPDSEHLCRAHTYLYHLLLLTQHLDLNRDHDAHRKFSWKNFYLFINPFSSEPSLTHSGYFQISAFDATMDILEFMINNRQKAEEAIRRYEKDVETENRILTKVQQQFNLTDILINPRIKKSDIIQCCQRLLAEQKHFLNLLRKCRLKIDKNYNLAQNGTISIPWNWSFADGETL